MPPPVDPEIRVEVTPVIPSQYVLDDTVQTYDQIGIFFTGTSLRSAYALSTDDGSDTAAYSILGVTGPGVRATSASRQPGIAPGQVARQDVDVIADCFDPAVLRSQRVGLRADGRAHGRSRPHRHPRHAHAGRGAGLVGLPDLDLPAGAVAVRDRGAVGLRRDRPAQARRRRRRSWSATRWTCPRRWVSRRCTASARSCRAWRRSRWPPSAARCCPSRSTCATAPRRASPSSARPRSPARRATTGALPASTCR